jgi:hypothetical protein
VLLEIKWEENGFGAHENRSVPAYYKTNAVGLQHFLQNYQYGRIMVAVLKTWNNFKDIVFEGTERFVPHKLLKQNLGPEYYNKEVKCLKVKARRA